MINPTCGSCQHRVSQGRKLPRICLFDGLLAVGGQTCRHDKHLPRKQYQRLPFSDRLRRRPEMRSELL